MHSRAHAPRHRRPLDYGKSHELGQPAPFRAQDLEHQLENVFNSQDYEPPRLPEAAAKLVQLSSQPEVSIQEIHDVLEADSLLVASILKTVRSPIYGRSDVQSLRDALVRLGLERIRDIVLEVATTSRMFKVRGYQGTASEIQRHNRAVAHLVRIVAKAAGFDAEYGFLCGLLHDVGSIALLQLVAEDEHTERPPLQVVLKAIRGIHDSASARVAKVWGLPDEVVHVLAAHHHLKLDGPLERVAAAVGVAEAISVQLDAGAPPLVDPVDRKQVERAVAVLGLPLAKLDEIANAGQAVLAAL
jgi:putative nucleotidyltransferase with HDIG domain